MKRPVRLSPAARGDIERLIDFLAERDANAPARARNTLERALKSLEDLSSRGSEVDAANDLRELKVKFGRHGYAIQYRVDPHAVFVAHIFHRRENR